jgi:hypothetical protein
MITSYNSSIPTNSDYSNLSSGSTDFICTNCTKAKGQKGKKYVKQRPYQTRTITVHESGEVICSTCGMVISDKIQSNGPEWRNFEQGGTIIGNRSLTLPGDALVLLFLLLVTIKDYILS